MSWNRGLCRFRVTLFHPICGIFRFFSFVPNLNLTVSASIQPNPSRLPSSLPWWITAFQDKFQAPAFYPGWPFSQGRAGFPGCEGSSSLNQMHRHREESISQLSRYLRSRRDNRRIPNFFYHVGNWAQIPESIIDDYYHCRWISIVAFSDRPLQKTLSRLQKEDNWRRHYIFVSMSLWKQLLFLLGAPYHPWACNCWRNFHGWDIWI